MKKHISKRSHNELLQVTIKLADDCHNGHSDFSITGSLYEVEKDQTPCDRNMIAGGCIHEEILKALPELKTFVDLHLSNYAGIPMYARANGIYWLKENIKKGANYLRISKKVAEKLMPFLEDENAFIYQLNKLGIVDQWEQEAKVAIKQLMALCETDKYPEIIKDRPEKTSLTKEEIVVVRKRIAEGYFSDKSIKCRLAEAIKKELANNLREIEAKKEIAEFVAETEYMIAMGICKLFPYKKANYIYYNHTHKLGLNWTMLEPYYTPGEMKKIRKLFEDESFSIEDRSDK